MCKCKPSIDVNHSEYIVINPVNAEAIIWIYIYNSKYLNVNCETLFIYLYIW